MCQQISLSLSLLKSNINIRRPFIFYSENFSNGLCIIFYISHVSRLYNTANSRAIYNDIHRSPSVIQINDFWPEFHSSIWEKSVFICISLASKMYNSIQQSEMRRIISNEITSAIQHLQQRATSSDRFPVHLHVSLREQMQE